MYGARAWDPVTAALQQSSRDMRQIDARALIENSADLLALYDGNQRFDALREIHKLFQVKESRDLYSRLIDCRNITALVIDRVTTIGKDPVSVTWKFQDGTPDTGLSPQLWEQMAHEDNEWDLFVQTVGRQTELLGTTVPAPIFDIDEKVVRFHLYTPNVFEVMDEDGDSCKDANRFRIYEDDGEYQLWDFSTDPPTVSQTSGWERGETLDTDIIARGPDGKAVNPFTPFRNGFTTRSYWCDKGQQEMLQAQRDVNMLLTQVRVILHHGAFQVPIAEGPGWYTKGKSGKETKLLFDPSQIVTVPDDPVSTKETRLRWDGPANEAFIEAHYKAIEQATAGAAMSRGIDPSFLRASAEARSGVSLFIGNQALNDKQRLTRTLMQRSFERFVDAARQTHDFFAALHGRPRFPEGVTATVSIPDIAFAQEPAAKLEYDTKAVEAGFISLKDKVREYNPGWTDEEVVAFIAERAPKPIAATMQPPGSAGANTPQGPAEPVPGK